MKRLIACGLLVILLGLIGACGRNGDADPYPSPTPYPYPYDDQNGDYPEPIPIPPDIPSFDHHEITLTIEPATRTITSGISRITFTNRTGQPLDTIVLRVFLNAFSEGSMNYVPGFERWIFRHGRDYGYMHIQHVTMNNEDMEYDLDGTILFLHPDEPLAPEQTVQLVLQYNAYVPMIAHRTGANNQAIWFGMALPILAVFSDGAWLTPDYYPIGDPFILAMANFDVEIITPLEYIVAGTGVNTDEIPIEDTGTRVTTFRANNVRDFAFAVSPYFYRERINTEGVDIHLYYFTEDLPTDVIFGFVSNIMEHFSYRIGLYPFDHIRIVETDMFIDYMVFSNMIFVDSAALRRPYDMALAHALGRQWFYNVVGNNPVAEPWLNNGLVRYLVWLLFDHTPQRYTSIANLYIIIGRRDDLSLTDGLWAFVNFQDYHMTHHVKGMLMFHALHERMGDELFWELIRRYFQTFYFRIATGEDFKNLADEIYTDSLEEFFSEWFVRRTVPPLPAIYDGEEEFIVQ